MFSVEPHHPQKSGEPNTGKSGKSHKIHTKVRLEDGWYLADGLPKYFPGQGYYLFVYNAK